MDGFVWAKRRNVKKNVFTYTRYMLGTKLLIGTYSKATHHVLYDL